MILFFFYCLKFAYGVINIMVFTDDYYKINTNVHIHNVRI